MSNFDGKRHKSFWERAISNFKKTLGKEWINEKWVDRVDDGWIDITLHFNLKDKEQHHQFELLGKLALQHKIQYQYQVTNPQDMQVGIFIPREGTNENALYELAHAMFQDKQTFRVEYKGEKRRAITDVDPEYPLETTTEKLWRRVDNRHGLSLVEPILQQPVKDEIRDEQETKLGENMLPPGPFRDLEIDNWKLEKARVAKEMQSTNQTGLPSTWMTSSNLARLECATQTNKDEIRRLFR